MKKLEWCLIEVIPKEGQIKKIKIGGKSLCLIQNASELYASSARCPHAGADLANGWCEDGKLVCPVHRHKFDLQTGKGDVGQGNYISVYPLKKELGRWYVGVKIPWWRRLF